MKMLNWCKSLATILVVACSLWAADRGTISLATTQSDSIRANNTSNRYTVVLSQAGRLSVHITSPGGSTGLINGTADVRWLNSSGTQQRRTDGFSLPHNDTMQVSAGTYSFEVIQRGSVTGNYSISINSTINETESNNTRATAQLLPSGYTVTGEITSTDNTDMYKYTTTVTGRLTINVSKGSLQEMWVQWYTEDGTEIMSTDYYSGDYSQYMDLNAGTYYIGINQYRNYTGTYNLRGVFTAAGNNDVESNNSISNAQSLTFGQTIKGFISYQDRVDMFKYTTTTTGRLAINVSKGSLTDMYVKWYTDDGTEIRSMNYYSGDYSQYMDLNAGTYYIGITPYSSSYSGTYNLSGEFTAAGSNDVEPNNDRSTAQLLTSGQTIRGFISYQDRVDMYRYELTQSGILTVNVTRDGLTDMYVRWYDVNGTQFFSLNYYSGSYNQLKDLDAGTYYIEITPYSSSQTGTYNLTGTISYPNAAPANISTQPTGGRVAINGSRTLSVTANSTDGGTLSYQWYRNTSANNTSGTLISGATSSSYSVPTTSAGTTYYYVIVTNTNNNATVNKTTARASDFVTVTVVGNPTISTQPTNQSIQFETTNTAAFTVIAGSNGATSLTYQWQRSINSGSSWSNVTDGTGGTTANYVTPTLTMAMGGYQYRCVITNDVNGSITSSSATLTVYSAPTVSTQPQPRTVAEGNTAQFSVTVAANGGSPLTYQWQRSTNGGTSFVNVTDGTGSTTATYTTTTTTAVMNGYVYRCVVTNNFSQTINSNTTVLTVIPSPTINIQPTNETVTASVGETREISVMATVPTGGEISYQWYSNTTASNNGGTLLNGQTNSSINVPTSAGGIFYHYVVVTNTQSEINVTTTSNVSTTMVNPGMPTIITQSMNCVVDFGESCNLSITAELPATGGVLSYQWYRNTSANTTGGTIISGATSSSYNVPTSVTAGVYYYYVEITNAQGGRTVMNASNIGTVTISSISPTIITQPTNKTIMYGETAEFTVAATLNGAISLTYQWQVSTDGTNFNNVLNGTGGTSATYVTPSATMAMNGYIYRCVVANNFQQSTTSNIAALMVNVAPPTITTQPTNKNIQYGETAEFIVEAAANGASELTYQWQMSENEESTIFVEDTIFRETFEGSTHSFTLVNGPVVGAGSRNVTISMQDSYGDGWNGASLRISVNGVNISPNPTISSGSSATSTFNVNAGDAVQVFWNSKSSTASWDSECSFQIYYTDTPSNILLQRAQESLTSTAAGTSLGSFTAVGTSQALTNQWRIGTATANGGTKSAYISNNSGTSNAYTITDASIVHMFSDIALPTSAVPCTLKFDWRGMGESSYDDLNVRLVETTVTPTAGNTVTVGTNLGTFRGSSSWNQASVVIPASNNGITRRLVFTWRNNASGGTQTSIAVDNIAIIAMVPTTVFTPSAFSDISGATEATYSIPAATMAMSGYIYRCIVTNNLEEFATSDFAMLTVNPVPPIIATQPISNTTIMVGQTAEFAVVAELNGASSLTYQWQISTNGGSSFSNVSNGTGGTTATYTIPIATITMNDYLYRCVIANNYSQSVISNSAKLTVNPVPPTISTHPANGTTTAGTARSISVSASGSGTLSYQWYSNVNESTTDGTLVGTNSSSYSIPASTTPGVYYHYVVVTNTQSGRTATTTSNVATTTVEPQQPTISVQPTNGTVTAGTIRTVSVTASVPTGGVLSYQWFRNTTASTIGGTLIEYATGSSYNISGSTESGLYYHYVAVTNTHNGRTATRTSNAVTTTVTPVITFHANGGSITPATGTTGTNWRLLSLPTPTRTGYTFNGWFTAETGGTQVTTSTEFSANSAIYARWTPTTYTISYNLNGGTVSDVNPISYTIEAENFTLNNPTRIGYTFTGWTGTNGTTPETTVSIGQGSTGNINYTANWTLMTYEITFDANGGTISTVYGTTNSNWQITFLPTPTRDAYTFNGWFTEETGGTPVTTNTAFNANTTIYAQWTAGPYGTPTLLSQLSTANQASQIHNGINLQVVSNAAIEIYGLKGNLVSRQNFGSGVYTVSFGHLPKGMYIVQVKFGSEKQILRVAVR